MHTDIERDPGRRRHGLLGEANGAIADLGLMLPYSLGVIVSGLLAPAAVFAGFGAAYLMSGFVYRMPIPVQPMKAIGALALAGGLDARAIMLSGLVIGAIMLLLAASGAVHRFARALPQTVAAGLQLGLGLMLAGFAVSLILQDPLVGTAALALLLALGLRPGLPGALLVVVGATAVNAWFAGAAGEAAATAAAAPSAAGGLFATLRSVADAVLPQLPLTIANAVFVTAALARDLAPERAWRVGESRLCLTTGAMNLTLAPLGALPMCHGAGGLAAHHRFGARTGWSMAMIGTALLAVAALPQEAMLYAVTLVPLPVLGALLLLSAKELVATPRLFDAVPSCRAVIVMTGLVTFLADPAIGFVFGIAAEAARRRIVRLGWRAVLGR